MVEFHPTITAGDLVTLAAFVLAMITVYVKFSNRLAIVESRMNDLWRWFMGDKGTRQRIGRRLDEEDAQNGR